MQPYKLLNHQPFTYTDLKYIFTAKLVSHALTQYSSTFRPDTTYVIGGGITRFMDIRILTWFISICFILTDITSRAGTRWVWIKFTKWSRSDSSILMVMRSCIAIFTLDMAGCAPAYIELIWILILFRVELRIWHSFLEDTPSLFTSKALLSASDARLLDWSHIWPSVFTVVVSDWVRYWILSWTNLMAPNAVCSCYPYNVENVPNLLRSLKISALRLSTYSPIWSEHEV